MKKRNTREAKEQYYNHYFLEGTSIFVAEVKRCMLGYADMIMYSLNASPDFSLSFLPTKYKWFWISCQPFCKATSVAAAMFLWQAPPAQGNFFIHQLDSKVSKFVLEKFCVTLRRDTRAALSMKFFQGP